MLVHVYNDLLRFCLELDATLSGGGRRLSSVRALLFQPRIEKIGEDFNDHFAKLMDSIKVNTWTLNRELRDRQVEQESKSQNS